MGVILRVLQHVGGSACLRALSLRLVCSLWKRQDRCFPYLQQMLTDKQHISGGGSSIGLRVDEVRLAQAACIRDICKVRYGTLSLFGSKLVFL